MKDTLTPPAPPWQPSLALAQSHATSARFPEMLLTCQHITQTHGTEPTAWLDVGSLLLNHGYLTQARDCFEQAQQLAPNDTRAQINLANVACGGGDHVQAQRIYAALQIAQPSPTQRSSAATCWSVRSTPRKSPTTSV
jgi:Flp pilus assembly protein TadD